MAKAPAKTTLIWNDVRYRELEADVRRFRARAVGGRLKELAMLGLLAERIGFRIEMTAAGPELAGGHTIILNPAPGSAAATLPPEHDQTSPLAEEEDLDPRALDFSAQFTT